MALQVWLPLNGDLRNLGLDNIEFTKSTVSRYESGKIGQALQMQDSDISFTAPSLIDAKVFSVAFWYKAISDSSITTNWNRVLLFKTKNSEGVSSSPFRFESSYINTYALSNHNNGGYPLGGVGGDGIITNEKDVWHHVCYVHTPELNRVYRDGELIRSAEAAAGMITGVITISDKSNGTDPNGLMNDLRIYDHALSQKEIKLLSQGLVAHYPLNDGVGGDNLIINTWEMPNQVFNGYALADYSFTEHLVSGQKYTITARIRMSEEKKSLMCYHSGGSYNMGWPWPARKGEDEIYSWTFTATDAMASQTSKLGYGYLRIYVSNNQGTQGSTPVTGSAYCHWIKIEKGEKSTPWVPNKQDALYSALGLDDGIVHDCSGYGHDGDIVGSISINSEAPRYAVSSSFSGSEQILAESPTAEAKSASLWIYIPSIGTNNLVFADYKSKLAFGFYSSYIVTAVTGDNNYRTTYESSLLTNNSWHHIVIVKSEPSGMELWIDGVKQTPRSGYDAWNSGMSDGLTIGARTNGNNKFIGSISDLRIYATALSADDIQNLYKTTASIDDHSNVYGYELQEENKPYYRQLIDINRIENGGNYKGTVVAESDGVHLNNIVWAIDSSFNNGHETGFIDVDPDNYWYLMSWTYTNTANNWFLIGVERYDENYTSTSNSSCLYTINTSSAVTRASSSQAIDITKDSNGNPVKHIKLRVLNNWNNTADIEGTAIIHKLTLMEIPKN